MCRVLLSVLFTVISVSFYDLIMAKKASPGVCGEVLCKCGVSDDDGTEMLQCDNCNRWSHCACYNLTEAEAAGDDFSFFCHDCKALSNDSPLPSIASAISSKYAVTGACGLKSSKTNKVRVVDGSGNKSAPLVHAQVQASCIHDPCSHCKEISDMKLTIGKLVSLVESLQLQVISLQDKFKSSSCSNRPSLPAHSQNSGTFRSSIPPPRSYTTIPVGDLSRPKFRVSHIPPGGSFSNFGARFNGGQERSANFSPSYAEIAQRGVKPDLHLRRPRKTPSSVVQLKSPSFRILWGTRLSFSVDDIYFSLSSIF